MRLISSFRKNSESQLLLGHHFNPLSLVLSNFARLDPRLNSQVNSIKHLDLSLHVDLGYSHVGVLGMSLIIQYPVQHPQTGLGCSLTQPSRPRWRNRTCFYPLLFPDGLDGWYQAAREGRWEGPLVPQRNRGRSE